MALSAVFRRYITSGLSDFPGLSISGRVPIGQDLINDVIEEWLASSRTAATPTHREGGQLEGFGPASILALVRTARVSAERGVVTVEFEIGPSS